MRGFVLTGLMAALALASCEAQTPPAPADVTPGEAAGQPPTAPTPDVPAVPPTAPSILQPIGRDDWRQRLEAGAGCNLSRATRDYLVVVTGDGVAKVGGEVIDLAGVSGDLNTLTRGGTFTGGGTTIKIDLAPDLGDGSALDETFTRPVRVEVRSGGAVERYEAAWTCGS